MIAALLAVVISMPSGWQHIDVPNPPGSTVEVLDLALGPTVDAFQSKINVIRRKLDDPATTIDKWAENATTFLKSQTDVTIATSHAEPLCNHPGWFVESVGPFNGRKLDLIQLALLDGGYEYVATYSRSAGSDADHDALAALETLCPQEDAQPSATPPRP